MGDSSKLRCSQMSVPSSSCDVVGFNEAMERRLSLSPRSLAFALPTRSGQSFEAAARERFTRRRGRRALVLSLRLCGLLVAGRQGHGM
eukprot:COSAG06_NODE_2480_length_6788_cov_3.392084_3_plen_88_part_00